MANARVIFEWAEQHGEVKTIDRILVKVMLLLIKNKIILTTATINKMETRLDLPDEIFEAIRQAAESIVGRPFPAELLDQKEGRNV